MTTIWIHTPDKQYNNDEKDIYTADDIGASMG
jgi:hypothetical protein